MSLETVPVDLKPFRQIVLKLGRRRVSLAKVMEGLRVLYPNERVVITVSDKEASIELYAVGQEMMAP